MADRTGRVFLSTMLIVILAGCSSLPVAGTFRPPPYKSLTVFKETFDANRNSACWRTNDAPETRLCGPAFTILQSALNGGNVGSTHSRFAITVSVEPGIYHLDDIQDGLWVPKNVTLKMASNTELVVPNTYAGPAIVVADIAATNQAANLVRGILDGNVEVQPSAGQTNHVHISGGLIRRRDFGAGDFDGIRLVSAGTVTTRGGTVLLNGGIGDTNVIEGTRILGARYAVRLMLKSEVQFLRDETGDEIATTSSSWINNVTFRDLDITNAVKGIYFDADEGCTLTGTSRCKSNANYFERVTIRLRPSSLGGTTCTGVAAVRGGNNMFVGFTMFDLGTGTANPVCTNTRSVVISRDATNTLIIGGLPRADGNACKAGTTSRPCILDNGTNTTVIADGITELP